MGGYAIWEQVVIIAKMAQSIGINWDMMHVEKSQDGVTEHVLYLFLFLHLDVQTNNSQIHSLCNWHWV